VIVRGRSACPDTRTLCGQSSGHWSGRLVSENRARPLVTAVPGDRPESLSRVDAWRSWAGRRVVLVDARMDRQWTRQAGPPEHTLEGALQLSSVDGCGHDRPMDAGGGHGRGCLARCPLRTPPSGSPAVSRQCRPQREPAAVRLDSEGRTADTSLEGASAQYVLAGCCAIGAAQHANRPTAVVRGEPSGTDATGTRRARTARTTLAPAGQQRLPARPEGKGSSSGTTCLVGKGCRPAPALGEGFEPCPMLLRCSRLGR
jgi:hypothetical protein